MRFLLYALIPIACFVGAWVRHRWVNQRWHVVTKTAHGHTRILATKGFAGSRGLEAIDIIDLTEIYYDEELEDAQAEATAKCVVLNAADKTRDRERRALHGR